jgi:hypothetical protein
VTRDELDRLEDKLAMRPELPTLAATLNELEWSRKMRRISERHGPRDELDRKLIAAWFYNLVGPDERAWLRQYNL